MDDKKRLYWNSCSFLDSASIVDDESPLLKIFNYHNRGKDELKSYKASVGGSSNEAIFRRTILDCSKNKFDFAIIAWSHPQRYITVNLDTAINGLDFSKLKKDADNKFVPTKWDEQMYGYDSHIPHSVFQKGKTIPPEILKLEPKGTDDTIFYTISLHNFFKQKGIPHLFLNMGKLDSDVLSARCSWLDGIDSINYLSLNDDDSILEKMQFSFIEHFLKLDNNPIINDIEINILREKGLLDKDLSKKVYTTDDAGHLSNIGYRNLSNIIYNYIQNNNLI